MNSCIAIWEGSKSSLETNQANTLHKTVGRQHDLAEIRKYLLVTPKLRLLHYSPYQTQAHTHTFFQFTNRTWNNKQSFKIYMFSMPIHWKHKNKPIKDDSQAKTWTQYPNKSTEKTCAISTEWFIDILWTDLNFDYNFNYRKFVEISM